jgi:hypothetical protein
LAKEKYNLSGIVYVFENGNIFDNKKHAQTYSKEINIDYVELDLEDKKTKNNGIK